MRLYKWTYTLFLVLISTGLWGQGKNVTLLGNWNREDIPPNGDTKYNETWGFVQNGTEYGVIGSTLGTHIIKIGNDNHLTETAYVPGAFQGIFVIHRDFHTYQNYLYTVCDQGTSTLQIIDLSPLPDSVSLVYNSSDLVVTAHNLFIDTINAKLYVCGPQGHAMSIYSLADPTNPQLLSHFDGVSYVHDTYVRNDTAWLNTGPQGLYVYDFSNVANPQLIGSLTSYHDRGYNHAGWLSEDGNTYVFTDETEGMRMKVCDVTDITDINVLSLFNSEVSENTIPHNVMVKNNYAFVSHYNDGLQIFDIRHRETPTKAGFYDTYHGDSPSNFKGAWGVYAFLPSGKILITDRQTGLYAFWFDPPPRIDAGLEYGLFPNPFSTSSVFSFSNPHELIFDFHIYNVQGQHVRSYHNISDDWIRIERGHLKSGMYFYELQGVNNEIVKPGKFIVTNR